MRLLMVGCERFAVRPGGLNRYFDGLVGGLRAAGHDVVALTPGEATHRLARGGAARTAWRWGVSVGRGVRAGWHADLLDVHFAWYGLGAVAVRMVRRVPLVVHFQGPWAEESRVAASGTPLAYRAKFRVERAVYRRADAVVVLCTAFGERVVRDYGVRPERVHVVAPAVDHDRFPAPPDTVAAAEAPFAVAARRLDPRMGLDLAVDAWPKVLAAHPDARLVIVGQGAEREALVERARVLAVADRVEFTGRVSDDTLVDLYRRATVSLVPTRALEGFGLVVLESLACGTPPVVTAVDALPEYVGRLDPSLIVPPEDSAALADRIVAAFDGQLPDSATCTAFAAGFTWEKVAADHVELYTGLTRTP